MQAKLRAGADHPSPALFRLKICRSLLGSRKACSIMPTITGTEAPTRLESAVVTAVASTLPAEELVQRLLATDDANRRRALIERNRLPPGTLGEVVERLLAEALRYYGADPPRM